MERDFPQLPSSLCVKQPVPTDSQRSLEPKYQIIVEHVLQNSCLDKLLQPPHRTPQLRVRLSSRPWLEARSERVGVRNHAIHEARLVDRVRRVLCDIERPQEEQR
jgi:hypothetical protein